jgi:hypothetical protein
VAVTRAEEQRAGLTAASKKPRDGSALEEKTRIDFYQASAFDGKRR